MSSKGYVHFSIHPRGKIIVSEWVGPATLADWEDGALIAFGDLSPLKTHHRLIDIRRFTSALSKSDFCLMQQKLSDDTSPSPQEELRVAVLHRPHYLAHSEDWLKQTFGPRPLAYFDDESACVDWLTKAP